jgi:hypothetical protein
MPIYNITDAKLLEPAFFGDVQLHPGLVAWMTIERSLLRAGFVFDDKSRPIKRRHDIMTLSTTYVQEATNEA